MGKLTTRQSTLRPLRDFTRVAPPCGPAVAVIDLAYVVYSYVFGVAMSCYHGRLPPAMQRIEATDIAATITLRLLTGKHHATNVRGYLARAASNLCADSQRNAAKRPAKSLEDLGSQAVLENGHRSQDSPDVDRLRVLAAPPTEPLAHRLLAYLRNAAPTEMAYLEAYAEEPRGHPVSARVRATRYRKRLREVLQEW